MLRVLPALVSLVFVCGRCSADAVDGGAGGSQPLDVRIGFAGAFEVGRWTECRVASPTGWPSGSRLVVRAPDPDGHVVSYPGVPAEEGAAELVALFMSGRTDALLPGDAAIEIVVESPNGELATQAVPLGDVRPLRQDMQLLATIGGPAGFEDADRGTRRRERHVVSLAALDELPSSAAALEALDVLVVAGNFEIGERTLDVVETWVRDGGHLVVATGGSVDRYLGSRFASAEWIPFELGPKPRLVRELDALVGFSGRTAPIPILGTVPVARVTAERGAVLEGTRSDPLVVRSVHGFGHVTLLAVDLDAPPLTEWTEGIDDFVRRLVDVRPLRGQRGRGKDDQRLAHSGIGDLASQLHATQDTFAEVNRSSRWTVMGLVLLYVVLIGPLDYLFVHRVLRRPAWTWATFPLVVVLATVLGVGTAGATNDRGLRANRFEIVDVDTVTDSLRGVGFVTVYSPEHRRYAIAARPVPLAATAGPGAEASGRLGWVGLPEDSYGGMYRQGGLRFHQLAYAHAEAPTAFENVPIPVWSTKSFRLRWDAPAGGLGRANLVAESLDRLRGSIRHDLPGPLEDWVLAYGSRILRPVAVDGVRPALRPGVDWRVDDESTTEPRNLRIHMTGTTSTIVEGRNANDTRVVSTESDYDPSRRDPRALIEMLSFHEAAGGTEYTGLANAPLSRFDLSNLVAGERAVLLGRLSRPAVEVEVNGAIVEEGRRETFVRIVFPVER